MRLHIHLRGGGLISVPPRRLKQALRQDICLSPLGKGLTKVHALMQGEAVQQSTFKAAV